MTVTLSGSFTDPDKRKRLTSIFLEAGYDAQSLGEALDALSRGFAPKPVRLAALDFSGLETHVLAGGEENHPDGWYRKFYSEAFSYDPNVYTRFSSMRTSHLAYRTKQPRKISRSFDLRVDDHKNTRLLAS